MKKLPILLFLALGMGQLAIARGLKETTYLKNGNMFRDMPIENIPNIGVNAQNADGSNLT